MRSGKTTFPKGPLMSSRIRAHLRNNLVGYVAVFIALTMGTAYASHPGGEKTIDSADIIDGEVFSDDVADDTLASGGLAAADLQPDSVGTSEVALNSLTASDLAPDSVGSSEVGLNSLTSSDLASSSVGASEVATNSLGGGDINEGTLGPVNSALFLENGSNDISPTELSAMTGAALPDCDPGAAFISCGAVSLNIPAGTSGPVLVLATGGFFGTGSGGDRGTCKIMEGTTQVGADLPIGQTEQDHGFTSTDGFALMGFDSSVSAGLHTWQLQCNQAFGDFQVQNPNIAAIYLL